jgi:hypothetical protein
VVDDVAPTVNPVALYSNNTTDPRVAGINNYISLIIQSDEPVSYNLVQASTNTIFYISDSHDSNLNADPISSGVTTPSGLPTGSLAWSLNNTDFTVYSFDSTSIRISSSDTKEGFFFFENLTATDRAGNTSNSFSSSDFANKIWIDPVAPTVQTSGFVTNVIDSGTVILSSGSSTQSGLLGGYQLIRTSGLLDYSFNIFELDNPITKGEVTVKVTLEGSGVGDYDGGKLSLTTIFDELTYSGITSGVKEFTQRIDTTKYSNGLYALRIELKDYVGNTRTQLYLINIENPVYYTSLTVIESQSGLIGSGVELTDITFVVNFSNFIVQSGSIANSIELTLLSDGGNTSNTTTALEVTYTPDSKTLLVKYTGGTKYTLSNGDIITIRIVDADGVTPVISSVLDYPLLSPFSQSLNWDLP